MSLQSARVLVTGGAGFIGSHLVQALTKAGNQVKAMAHYRGDPSLHNLEYLSSEELAGVEIVRGDIADPFFVRNAVKGCDVVFHLAALIGIPYSYLAPASYVSTNVLGTLNILEACKEEGVSRLVHTSTSECYGSARYRPIDEEHPLQGQSPYSASKISADKLAESYVCTYDLPVVTIRPFNTFGPRQSARAVIPTIISQLLSADSGLRLGSLSPIRDLTFVTDTVAGFIKGSSSEAAVGQVINLGFGRGISIGSLAEKLMDLMGVEVPILSDESRVRPDKSEVLALISDNRKAKQLLDWEPRVSLEEGLGRTVAFVRENLGGFRDRGFVY